MTLPFLILLLFSIAILIFWSALFSGLETALFSLQSHQLRRLEESHPSLQRFLQIFRDNPRRVLNVLLLADVVVNVPLVVLCLFLIWKSPLATQVPQWLAATVIFAIIVLLCDLIPKLLALSAPYHLSALGVSTLGILLPSLDRVGHLLERASTWLMIVLPQVGCKNVPI
jgi:magnesium and cobalt exporter, CNNM family